MDDFESFWVDKCDAWEDVCGIDEDSFATYGAKSLYRCSEGDGSGNAWVDFFDEGFSVLFSDCVSCPAEYLVDFRWR